MTENMMTTAAISRFPKLRPCRTADGVTIHGIGKTLHACIAWYANLQSTVSIAPGTVLQRSGSMGCSTICGKQVGVIRVNVHPYGPEIMFRD